AREGSANGAHRHGFFHEKRRNLRRHLGGFYEAHAPISVLHRHLRALQPTQLGRSAVATGSRAACSAGSEAPIKPMTTAHSMPLTTSLQVTVSLNTRPCTSTTLPL